jgi:hypothetical protein
MVFNVNLFMQASWYGQEIFLSKEDREESSKLILQIYFLNVMPLSLLEGYSFRTFAGIHFNLTALYLYIYIISYLSIIPYTFHQTFNINININVNI